MQLFGFREKGKKAEWRISVKESARNRKIGNAEKKIGSVEFHVLTVDGRGCSHDDFLNVHISHISNMKNRYKLYNMRTIQK